MTGVELVAWTALAAAFGSGFLTYHLARSQRRLAALIRERDQAIIDWFEAAGTEAAARRAGL